MRAPALLIVLFASALAIEDFEREALGAPGPTRANLRGRGLKFGHSVTEVEEEATDPPAPAPTFAATDPPAPAPTAGFLHGGFADYQDCELECSDCEVVVPSQEEIPYDFTNFPRGCICYVGPMRADHDQDVTFSGTQHDDCIAITEWTNEPEGSSPNSDYVIGISGQGGDDVIVAAAPDSTNVAIHGGEGDDDCTSYSNIYTDCEVTTTIAPYE